MALKRSWPWALAPAAFGVGIAVAAARIVHGRALVEANALGAAVIDPSARATALADGIRLQSTGLSLLAVLLTWPPFVFAAIAILLTAVRRLRARQSTAPTILILVAATLPVAATGLALSAWTFRIAGAFAALAGVDPAEQVPRALKGLTDAGADLAAARVVVAVTIAVAAALAIGAAALAARRGQVVSPLARDLTGALFFVAVGAFAATRGYAADAKHPLSSQPNSAVFDDIAGAPRVELCRGDLPSGPLLHVDPLTLDGRALTVDELGDALGTLRKNWAILHPDGSAPSHLLLLAPSKAHAGWIAAALAPAQAAGFTHIDAIVVQLAHVDTHTLGTIERPMACARAMELGADGEPMAKFNSWGEMVAAANLAELRLQP